MFYNRLNSGWTLGSDVTTYYAYWCDNFYIDDWELVKKCIMNCAKPIIENAINEVLR